MQSKHRNSKKEHYSEVFSHLHKKNLKISKHKGILANLHHSLGIRTNEI